jgi:hypothetical protein
MELLIVYLEVFSLNPQVFSVDLAPNDVRAPQTFAQHVVCEIVFIHDQLFFMPFIANAQV